MLGMLFVSKSMRVIAFVAFGFTLHFLWSGQLALAYDANFQSACCGLGRVSVDDVRNRIYSGANVNQKDDAGYTPLHCTANSGRTEIVKVLLENRASPNARDNSGRVPLHFACTQGHLEVVKLLVAAGADINASYKGISAIKMAARAKHQKVVEYLLRAGADER